VTRLAGYWFWWDCFHKKRVSKHAKIQKDGLVDGRGQPVGTVLMM